MYQGFSNSLAFLHYFVLDKSAIPSIRVKHHHVNFKRYGRLCVKEKEAWPYIFQKETYILCMSIDPRSVHQEGIYESIRFGVD